MGTMIPHSQTDGHVPSEFMGIPPELRRIIYRELFTDSKTGSEVRNPIPNPRTFRPVGFGISKVQDRFHCKHPSILRVCKSVQAEAADVLYGENLYVFDDWHPDRHLDHYLRIAYCGITSLYTWLQLIGPANRRALRSLRIEIENPVFFFHKGESIPNPAKDVQVRGGKKIRTRLFSGKFITDALLLLSRGHLLQTLELRVTQLTKTWFPRPLMEYLLRPEETSKLVRCLKGLGGSVIFTVLDNKGRPLDKSEMPDGSLTMYEDLKRHMATVKPPSHISTETIIQNGGPKTMKGRDCAELPLRPKRSQIGDHHDYKKRITEVKNNMQNWTGSEEFSDHVQDLIDAWERQMENLRIEDNI